MRCRSEGSANASDVRKIFVDSEPLRIRFSPSLPLKISCGELVGSALERVKVTSENETQGFFEEVREACFVRRSPRSLINARRARVTSARFFYPHTPSRLRCCCVLVSPRTSRGNRATQVR